MSEEKLAEQRAAARQVAEQSMKADMAHWDLQSEPRPRNPRGRCASECWECASDVCSSIGSSILTVEVRF